ncbi:ribosome biogenesis GTPase Der [bacterium]|nr:ribosome biogenesis GTPase Der [bacterium]
MNALPVVAIVGRPNVGKSTFINRLVGSREAIVHDMPGVTRDRLYLRADWNGRDFVVVDTGGIVPGTDEELLQSVEKQAMLAVEEADVIVFVVDGEAGVTPVDEDIANLLRTSKKPLILAVNKLDNVTEDPKAAEFYELGLGEPRPMSSLHGLGIGDMLDDIVNAFPPESEEPPPEELRIALVGKPNAGKSSLTNALLGHERMIVSPVAGTTRDAIDTRLEIDGKHYTLVDTAGIRRKAKVDYGVEAFSVVRALKAIERADVIVMMIDGAEGVSEQDQRIAGIAEDSGKALVIAVNKWDLVPKDTHTMPAYRKKLEEELRHVKWAPVVFISALTGQRVPQILEAAEAAAAENTRRITTGVINEVIAEATTMNPPPARSGRRLKIYYVTQVSAAPPTFINYCNEPKLVTDHYKRYLENKIREAFGFAGTPIRLIFRPRREKQN